MKQDELVRFGVSMEGTLLDAFDELIAVKGYSNRSEAIRDLIRDQLITETVQDADAIVVGILFYVYDHHIRELESNLTGFQHNFYHSIISSTHIHLDHDHCLELTIIKDRAGKIQEMAEHILSMKGVRYGKLMLTSVDALHE